MEKLKIKLTGGTILLIRPEDRVKLTEVLSNAWFWDEENKRWVGDMAFEEVVEYNN